jgi:hypothetical protein
MEWCVLKAIGIGGEHIHGIREGAFVDAGYVDDAIITDNHDNTTGGRGYPLIGVRLRQAKGIARGRECVAR